MEAAFFFLLFFWGFLGLGRPACSMMDGMLMDEDEGDR